MDGFSPSSVVQINSEKPQDARYVLYRAGDRIYENGARSDGFYTIASGSVEITGIDPETGEETSRVLIAGDHFGERLLIGATRRIATAVAIEDTKVLVQQGGHQRTVGIPAGGGRADTPAGGGQVGIPAGATLRMGMHAHAMGEGGH